MYVLSEKTTIERRFIQVGKRVVHFRTAGSGPALFLFHQSPTSSAELVSEIETFSQYFTVIAPDTPGYGWSDPLPIESPSISDFADAVTDLMNVLKIRTAGFYGAHTGAMIAADMAFRHQDRVSVAVLDGFVVLEEAERADLLANYFQMPPSTPEGGHLPWAWARIRDQMIFYPWYRKQRSSRMKFDVAPAAALQPYLLDLLRAYRGGVPAYRAAFEYDARTAAAGFKAPTFMLNYQADAIADHPDRLASVSPLVIRERLEDPESLFDRAIEIFKSKLTSPITLPEMNDQVVKSHGIAGSWLFPRQTGSQKPVLLVHQPGASIAQWASIGESVDYLWHAIDLPGHGCSGPVTSDLAAFEKSLLELIVGHDIKAIVTLGDSGWVVAKTARSLAIPLLAIDLDDDPAKVPAAELAPEDCGGHLLKAWYAVRDAELFHPWCIPTLDNALDREFDIEPQELTKRTLDLLTAAPWLSYWKSWSIQAAQENLPPESRVWRKASFAHMTNTTVPQTDLWPDEQSRWMSALAFRLDAMT